MPWIPLAVAGIGAATSLIGANQQKKANEGAQAENRRLQEEQNNSAWANWLATKGIAPTTPVAAGVMPTAGNYTAQNVRLPLWATLKAPNTTVSTQPTANRAFF